MALPAWETDPEVARCECCSRPMMNAGAHGTIADGTPSADYCDCSLAQGNWIEPDVTMTELIDRCVDIWVKHDVTDEDEASGYFRELFPTLKRWASK